MSGKGDGNRTSNHEQYRNNYDTIFRANKKELNRIKQDFWNDFDADNLPAPDLQQKKQEFNIIIDRLQTLETAKPVKKSKKK